MLIVLCALRLPTTINKAVMKVIIFFVVVENFSEFETMSGRATTHKLRQGNNHFHPVDISIFHLENKVHCQIHMFSY